jgi:hypothetical protein
MSDFTEGAKASDGASVGLVANNGAVEKMGIHGRYTAECYDKDGNLKWTEDFDNIVVTAGKNDMLDKYLAGSTWSTGTVYMGLKSTGTPDAGDTMGSHATWTELNITASSGVRQSVTFAAAGSGQKATSSAVSWSVTTAGPTTVYGCFIVIGGTSANGNTTGTLFSSGDFSQSRAVISGDTLNVTYTATL